MRISIIIAVFLVLPVPGHSATLHVPGNYPTIQQAINAASASDVIIVAPGTYPENIDFLGKAITVKSDQGPGVTAIDGNQSGSVVSFDQGETPAARLEGFTITNGSGVGGYYGGGIYLYGYSCPTIIDNVISGNVVDSPIGCGGGIYMGNHSDAAITQNVIAGNAVRGDQFCQGGGIYCYESSPAISANSISGNLSDGMGGGIFFERSSPVIEGNTIDGNSAELWGGGIAFIYYCSPSIANNVISKNTVNQQGGGGIMVYGYCSGAIADNVIAQNSSYGASGIYCADNTGIIISGNTIRDNHCPTAGGGIYCLDDSPIIIGNAVLQNSADQAGGGIHVGAQYGASPEIRDNAILQNKCSEYGGGGIAVYFASGVYSGNIVAQNECLISKGGGLSIISASGSFSNNIICLNSAGNSGGGIHCGGAVSPLLTNNTVCGNIAKNNSGGLRCDYQSKLEITNSIFWNNQVTSGGAGPQICVMDSSNLTISYSDVEGGEPLVFVAPNSKMNWGAGMIDADPLFADAATEDFHLSFPSPCREGGDLSSVLELEDFEGDPRIACGGVDMGADEFHPHLYATGDATPGGWVNLKFVGWPGTAPVALCIGSGVLDAPMHSMWGDWYLQFPFLGPIPLGTIPAPAGILVLSGTLPPAPTAPYDVPMQAFIGASLSNCCVLEVR